MDQISREDCLRFRGRADLIAEHGEQLRAKARRSHFDAYWRTRRRRVRVTAYAWLAAGAYVAAREAWLAHSLWYLASAITGGAWLAAQLHHLAAGTGRHGGRRHRARRGSKSHSRATGTASPPANDLRTAWLAHPLLPVACADYWPRRGRHRGSGCSACVPARPQTGQTAWTVAGRIRTRIMNRVDKPNDYGRRA
jgi:hypothetical protein